MRGQTICLLNIDINCFVSVDGTIFVFFKCEDGGRIVFYDIIFWILDFPNTFFRMKIKY